MKKTSVNTFRRTLKRFLAT